MFRWTAKIEGGAKRVNQAMVCVPDSSFVLSFGGFGPDFDDVQALDIHCFDIRTLSWREIESTNQSQPISHPPMRWGHTATVIDDKVYVIHGQKHVAPFNPVPFNRVDIFDLKSKSWSTMADDGVDGRIGHTANLVNSLIYVFAGSIETGVSNSVQIFDPSSLHWSKPPVTGKPPLPRRFHTAVTFGESFYVYGGVTDWNDIGEWDGDSYPEDIKVFNTSTLCWTGVSVTCGLSPIGRRSHSAVAYCNKMVVYGGYNGRVNQYLSDLLLFDVSESSWSSVLHLAGPSPGARRRFGCCMIDEKRLLIYGGRKRGIADDIDYYNDDIDYADTSDSYVLNFQPTLEELCLVAIVNCGVDYSYLPKSLRMRLDVLVQKHVTVF